MKAAYINELGEPDVLEYGDLPDPKPGPGQVLVDVHAASVNAADWKVRRGMSVSAGISYDFPYVMGRDFSGTVAALGEGVSDLSVGDAVFGVCDEGQEGAYAEKLAIKAAIIARKPTSLSHVEAAALALVGLTSHVALEDTIKLQAGETILVQGGAGGVAGYAIQLAKHLGARVITTASPANHAYVKALGADEVIDYHTTDFTKVLSGLDAVFDTVGGDVTERSFLVLRPGGRAAFIASGREPPKPPRGDVVSLRPRVGRGRHYMERIAELHAKGAVKSPEIKTYALAAAAEAHALSESRHFRGKLVFKVR